MNRTRVENVSRMYSACIFLSSGSPGVIEESTAPERVVSSGASVKEAGVGPVEVVQPIFCVAGGMTVDHVQKNRDAHGVCGINQMLQIIRSAEAAEGKRMCGL